MISIVTCGSIVQGMGMNSCFIINDITASWNISVRVSEKSFAKTEEREAKMPEKTAKGIKEVICIKRFIY